MKINGTTKILGIFGNPIRHSLSPIMHNAAIEHLGLDFVYVPFEVQPENLCIAVDAIKAMNLCGINVTIPFKQSVIKYLDSMTEEAKTIGAVNTIINENGRLIGDNTDGKGFIRSLRETLKFNVNDKDCVIIGAGGAARAIAVSLIFAGADKVYISDINDDKALEIAKLDSSIKAVSISEISGIISKCSLIVNATPCGMENDVAPFDLDFLSEKNVVYDIVYNRETPLLKHCLQKNIKCISGLDMLLYQGVLSFESWTKTKTPVEIMRQALRNAIK